MKTEIITASSRGYFNHGWLKTYHTFSFAEYFNRQRMNFGALRVLNDDFVAPQTMFPSHPHKNMEIITIVLSGTVEHTDSLGNTAYIKQGEIQVMSAGSGIIHSEGNASEEDELNLFQIWIYPNQQNISPRYEQRSFIQQLAIKNCLHQLVGPNNNNQQLKINQTAYISLGEFNQVNQLVNYQTHAYGQGIFIMPIDGAIMVTGQEIQQRDAILISETSNIEFSILSETTKLISRC